VNAGSFKLSASTMQARIREEVGGSPDDRYLRSRRLAPEGGLVKIDPPQSPSELP
jgi:hypothetical protein